MNSLETPSKTSVQMHSLIHYVATLTGTIYLALLPFEYGTAIKNVVLTVLILCVLCLSPSRLIKDSYMRTAFVAWLIAGLVSVAWSHDPASSLSSVWREIVKSAIVFYCFYVLGYRKITLQAISSGIIAGSGIFATLALYDLIVFNTWQGPHSPPRYDISVSALAWAAFLFLTIFACETRKFHKYLASASLLALLSAGFMSSSRSFALAVILCLGLITVIYINWSSKSQRFFALVSLGLSTLAPLLLFSLFNNNRSLTTFFDREALYGKTIEKISNNPWFGTGFGHETDRMWYANTFSQIPGMEFLAAATHPHNIILSYMDQMGIFGLLILLILFFSLTKPLLQAARSACPKTKIIGTAGLMLVLGTLVSNTFNYYFTRHHLWLFIGMMGLFHGWLKQAEESAISTTPSVPQQD